MSRASPPNWRSAPGRLFQEVEKLGGMEAALRAGFPQKAVAATAAEKLKAVARRRDSIVGVNQYANPKEKPLGAPAVDAEAFHKRRVQQVASHRTSLEDDESELVLEKLAEVVESRGTDLFEACVEAVAAGATLGEITRAMRINDRPCAPVTPVCITRAAAPLERLREATDRYAARPARRPRPSSATWARSRNTRRAPTSPAASLPWAVTTSFLPTGSRSPEDAARSLRQEPVRAVAVICSTDDNYPALVPPLVQALRASTARRDHRAGGLSRRTRSKRTSRAGVDEFIHIRADALEVLSKLHSRLGIA